MKKSKFIKVLVSILVVCGIAVGGFFVVRSLSKHEHVFDKQVTTSEYLQKEATCKQKASYFYSCECGEKGTETFEHGELGEHDYTTCVNNGDGTHTKICSRDSSHTMTENCYGGTATCKEKAKCEGCGEEYGDLKAHDYTELKHNETEHWHECACGEKSGIEGHKGGTATCTEKAKCEVCGKEYGDLKAHDYTELKHNETEHWYECVCGDKQTVQPHDYSTLKKNETEHWHECACGEKSGVEGHKGGTATCTEKAKCEICGEAYGSLKDHSFTNYQYDNNAECEKDGTETARCDYGCGETDTRTKQGSALSHTYSDWIPNEDGTHYKYCTHGCGDKTTEDCTIVDGECQTCGYTIFTDGLVLTLNSAGTEYSVTGYTGTEKSVVIPNTYKSKPVTRIENVAFYNCSKLISIKIPTSVTSIGLSALFGCNSLESITLPFAGATKEGVSNTHFGYLFGASRYQDNRSYVPTSLKTVVITGETIIRKYAFYQCTSLRSIEIPNSITRISQSAFYGCNSLKSIALPFINIGFKGESSTYLGYIFAYEHASQNDFVPTTLKTVVITGGTSIGDYTFSYCKSLTNIVIGNSVTSIGYRAFSGCSSLASISIGNNVTNIGNEAFKGCDNLQYNIEGNLKYLGNDENRYHYLVAPTSTDITSATINGRCKVIGNSAFTNCQALTNITIPDSVTSIDRYAFYYCTSLTSIEIPNSVTSIGEGAFYDCSSLKYNEKDGLKYLGNSDNAYLYLADVVDTSVKTVKIDSNCKFIGTSAFSNCSSLTSVEIPDSVTSIGDYAFYYCRSLSSVKIGNSVTIIGSSAFSGCSSLTSITIPNSVTSIGSTAFSSCKSLTNVYFVNPNGWWCSLSSTATRGTNILSSDLSNTSNAAKLLAVTYNNYYWNRAS
ncbi:MAG: leucine-rich repeat domain-containing protein [Clostridia bacterium]|nr:leucine-rich repeat domain-containing protein [Clostridia bacterium]